MPTEEELYNKVVLGKKKETVEDLQRDVLNRQREILKKQQENMTKTKVSEGYKYYVSKDYHRRTGSTKVWWAIGILTVAIVVLSIAAGMA